MKILGLKLDQSTWDLKIRRVPKSLSALVVTCRRFESRRDRRLSQLCAVHKVGSFYPLRLRRHAPSRIDGICQPQHTMLSRID